MKHTCIVRLMAVVSVAILLGSTAGWSQDGTHVLSLAEARGKRIVLVGGEAEKDHPSDDAVIRKYLQAEGYVVTMAKEDGPAVSSGADLILLSSTADAREIGDKYAASPIPVFTWNTVDYPDMHMTGPERHTDFETARTTCGPSPCSMVTTPT